ncbi:MAG: hypothetical protein Q8P22_12980, partial [Chloroflexota bacterium]|nr:hypothetical protein [Chloroflexota bacterium]
RRNLGLSARAVAEGYGWASIAEQVEAVYERLVALSLSKGRVAAAACCRRQEPAEGQADPPPAEAAHGPSATLRAGSGQALVGACCGSPSPASG